MILIEGARFPPFGFDIAEISLEASKCLGGNREAKSIDLIIASKPGEEGLQNTSFSIISDSTAVGAVFLRSGAF